MTLTELMIVISVLGLLLAVTAPAMGRFVSNWRVSGEAAEIANSLRLARAAAVTKNMPVIWVFDASAGDYFYVEDADGNGSAGGTEYQSGTRQLADGITISAYTTPQQWITFEPRGSTADGGTLTVSNGRGYTKIIRVFSGTGNVTVN